MNSNYLIIELNLPSRIRPVTAGNTLRQISCYHNTIAGKAVCYFGSYTPSSDVRCQVKQCYCKPFCNGTYCLIHTIANPILLLSLFGKHTVLSVIRKHRKRDQNLASKTRYSVSRFLLSVIKNVNHMTAHLVIDTSIKYFLLHLLLILYRYLKYIHSSLRLWYSCTVILVPNIGKMLWRISFVRCRVF